MWRAMNSPALAHGVLYLDHRVGGDDDGSLLVGRSQSGASSCAARRPRSIRPSASPSLRSTLRLLMWLVAFLSVGGEWFLMWQSKKWNGQEAAFRMFTVVGIVLLLVAQPENEGQP